MAEYIGPGPAKDTGYHRYVFILYKQPGELSFKEQRMTRSPKGRDKFSIRKFSQKYSLGEPVAGNFFEAQFDESVIKLFKSLGVSA